MKCICGFNPMRDKGLVIKGLAPDISDMIENHTIPDTAAECVYNQLTELKQVGCKICDQFDAIMVSRAIHAAGLSPSSGTGSSQAAGSTAPVQASSSSSSAQNE